ncbi:uncharacterized protein Nmag_0744 [Natrialba magadii ATCC 43099]|uniref:Uncharacterized protein n=1 Tax=Natrialba magadii (strain ATCC 43099 / DSM 3394 / CCM 3739 / CIP 104546 / IAM 13178 / JCM 8861 / NBRC 102185 / NCIMB 2190 / MS3) TaxID=547559 RepID=D3SZJ5_NATMM|nr:uncharacterized protein Nmag_0744 [Natrialba magadii ATCC 43099]
MQTQVQCMAPTITLPLENQVSTLGEYVSEQVRPASTKRQMVTEAGKDALSSGAGLATGAGIAALGLAGPLGTIIGAGLAGAATKGRLETIVDVRNNCSPLGARVDQSLL